MVKAAAVLTHRRTQDTAAAIGELLAVARRAGVTLHLPRDEAEHVRRVLRGSRLVYNDKRAQVFVPVR